ncbi:MAG: hypothetical protein CVT92_14105 [Bacteroidetes bacterium HGW-Bacteroidetes-1]|jgi:trigger factor|nr:MAG: hypothetical protein CVT92_14105 [Bacteroidetes bacterium HGW-Bacteroidetes-1]
MQVSKEQTGEATATIEIKITKTDYEPEVNKSLKEYQRKASIPGFRPGKVPFGLVKKMYGDALLADSVNKFVSNSLNDYIIENKIKIIGYPLPDIDRTGSIDFDTKDEFSFFFNIALSPEFDINLEDISLTYPKVKASAEEIQNTIDKLLKDYPNTVYPDSLKAGDEIELRFVEADQDKNEIENGFSGKARFNVDEITDQNIKDTFLSSVLGAEFVVNLNEAFGGDNEKVITLLNLNNEQHELASSNFNVVIDEIVSTELAEFNEEFFKKIFPSDEINSEEDFRNRIGAEIEKQLEQQSDYFVYSLALKKVIEETPVNLPEEFMKRWIVDNSEGKLSAEEIESNYPDYEKSLRFQLIEEKLIGKYPELKVEEQEVRRFVLNYFFGTMPPDMEIDEDMENRLASTVDSILKNKKEEQRIISELRERKMIKLIKEKVSLTEQEMTPEEFKKLVSENKDLEIIEHDHE